jgi:hypothetical protein
MGDVVRPRQAWWIAATLAGCSFKPAFDGTHYRCAADGTCPTGQTCVADVCVIGESPDAQVGADAPAGAPDAAVSQGRCGTLALLRDDFMTDQLGTIWDRWTDGGPVATVTGGHLEISIPQNTQDLGAGYASVFSYDFTGSVLEAAVSQVASGNTILEVRGDGPAPGKMQMVLEGGILTAWIGGQGGKAQLTYDPLVHKRWRLREDNGTTYWEWSTDAVTWTELYHQIDPFPIDHVIVELAADGTTASKAIFEEVNVDGPAPAGFCGAAALVDDFGGGGFGPSFSSWAHGGATIAETGGQAVASIPAVADAYAGLDSRRLYDLRESAIYIDTQGTSGAAGFTNFVQLVKPAGNATMIELGRQGASLICDIVSGGSTSTSKTVAYDAVATRYVRVRLAGTTVHWETSADAITWNEQHAATTAIDWSAVHVNLGQGFYAAPAAPVTAAWSGVNTK